MKKVVIIGILAVLVALGAGVYYLFSNLNSIVAQAIERHGSEATGTRVSVSGVDISLGEGSGSISGLRVASPEGFRAGDAFELGDIRIDLDLGTVREDPVVIDEIHIRAPVINAQVLEDGTSNIESLRKRIQERGGGSGNAKGAQKKLRIKRFVFEQGRIEVDASALGLEQRSLTLSEIRMSDVGGAGGASPEEIARLILTAVARTTASEIAKSEINRRIEEKLGESLSDKARDLLDKIGN